MRITTLIEAAEEGDTAQLQNLITAGVNVNAQVLVHEDTFCIERTHSILREDGSCMLTLTCAFNVFDTHLLVLLHRGEPIQGL